MRFQITNAYSIKSSSKKMVQNTYWQNLGQEIVVIFFFLGKVFVVVVRLPFGYFEKTVCHSKNGWNFTNFVYELFF